MGGKHKLEPNLVGVAGEYLVAAELTMRGHLASITLRNSRGVDILASSADGLKSASFQVKTNSDGSAKWMTGKKAEDFHAPNHYYVFVALADIGDRPRFHIVPSQIVAETVKASHAQWLAGTKRDGSARKDSSMRVFRDTDNTFLENWQVIDL